MPPMIPDIAALRRDYQRASLSESDVNPDPVAQFIDWLNQAIQANCNEPNAMSLATASKTAVPSARICLLKDVDSGGFVFYTNYASRKGLELAENPHAAMLFFWPELERQARIEGTVTKTSEADSDAYFQMRPIDSRASAAASAQSSVIASRSELERRVAEIRKRFGDNIPRPPEWGGYRLKPTAFEFWQGRVSRLHDRIVYLLDEQTRWKVQRLSP